MAEKYSNTGTTTTIGNEVAKLLRITKKAKENVNKTISNWTSEKTGIFKTDVKDQRLQTTPEVEDKLNNNQQDLAHLLSNQRLQTTPEVEDKLNNNQQDLAHLLSNRQAITITERFRIKSQATYVIPAFLMTVFKGEEDVVRCHYCDGGLRHWESGDVPWEEHARWFLFCKYNIKMKGRDFIDNIKAAREQRERIQNMDTSLSGENGHNSVLKTLRDLQINDDDLAYAGEEYVKRKGNSNYKVEDILDLVHEKQKKPASNPFADLAWVERSNKTSGPFYNDVYGKDYDDSINNSGRSSVKDGTNYAVAGVSDQDIGTSIFHMDTGEKDQKTTEQFVRIDKILSQDQKTTEQFVRIDKILSQEIQDIKMKLQGRKIYIEAEKANFQTVKKRLHTDMYLANDNKYMESVEAFGKEFHVQIDEYKKCLFSAMLLIDNDEKTHQHLGKKEKLIKKVKQLQSQLLKENQLIELENTELVFPLLKEQHVLKEREGDFQKEDELKEQVKIELLAENILFPRTKIRNAKSKMNFSSVYRACYLYRKNILARMLVSLEQLIEALDSIKSPHYIWPSGHPLILSKERQIELDFFPNEYMERLLSFLYGRNRRHRTWNSDQIVRPEPMVLAGFSYDGEDDKVVCKSCGAISDVNDWSDDDEDYAFTMHRRTGSSHCEFLRKFDPRRSKM